MVDARPQCRRLRVTGDVEGAGREPGTKPRPRGTLVDQITIASAWFPKVLIASGKGFLTSNK